MTEDAPHRETTPPSDPRPSYRLPVHAADARPDIDRTGFNRLANELEDATITLRVDRPTGSTRPR